jgi:cell division septal protein FtsQ
MNDEFNDDENFIDNSANEAPKGRQVSAYYGRRSVKKKRMERKLRQGQMWLGRLHALVKFAIILVMIFVGYKVIRLHQWYLPANTFNSLNNPSLEIVNNKIVPSYKILAALRRTQVPPLPIYRIQVDDMKKNIMQLEPVQNVYIRRFWFPARLQVIVQERVPVITISPSEKVPPIAFFAKGGKLIGREYMPLDKSFKTTLVLSYGVRGDDYHVWDKNKIKLIQKIAAAVQESSHEPVQYVDCRRPNDIFVKIPTANLRIGEIDDTMFSRIARISSILPQIRTLDKKIKYIDLRWKDANYIKLS